MTLADLNAATREEFVAAIGWVFEHSPWVAERAWTRRPFASLTDLHAAMAGEVAAAGEDDQLALLRAHPDLGTRARMSRASTGEQQGAGLDSLTATEYADLQQRNAEYQQRFGFPFVFAVGGKTTHDVLAALSQRVTAPRDAELAEALRQVARIAWMRLEKALEVK